MSPRTLGTGAVTFPELPHVDPDHAPHAKDFAPRLTDHDSSARMAGNDPCMARGGTPERPSLVLGAGGRAGLAYHASTLLALQLHGIDVARPATMVCRLCAATETGERRVLTGGPGEIVPARAVAASCAVPTVYSAVRHDGERLVDGGVHSTKKADLASSDPTRVVVVAAPMCGQSSARWMSRAPRRSLDEEVAALESPGKAVVVFTPSQRMSDLMGVNLLSGRRTRAIVGQPVIDAAGVIAAAAFAASMPNRRSGADPVRGAAVTADGPSTTSEPTAPPLVPTASPGGRMTR
jgi:hypothetical protein